jgi:iron(III) transport system permease protein
MKNTAGEPTGLLLAEPNALLLYTAPTTTMPVKVFVAVLDGEFGVAAALSTLLLLCTGACVYAVLRLGQSKESAFL